jgi:hypothetical protein
MHVFGGVGAIPEYAFFGLDLFDAKRVFADAAFGCA